MLRRIIAPLVLRFKDTDSLLDAMDLLERGYRNPKCTVSKVELERAMRVIAKELLRRKVIFWT